MILHSDSPNGFSAKQGRIPADADPPPLSRPHHPLRRHRAVPGPHDPHRLSACARRRAGPQAGIAGPTLARDAGVHCGPGPELVATYRLAWPRRKEGPGRNGYPSRKHRKGPACTPNRGFESARGHRIRRGRRWRGRPPPRTAPPPRGTPGTRPRAAPARRRTARTGARGSTAAAACRAGPPCTPRTRPAPPTPRRRPGPAARRTAARAPPAPARTGRRRHARARQEAGAAAPLLQRAPLQRTGCAMDRVAVAPCPPAFTFLMREPRPVHSLIRCMELSRPRLSCSSPPSSFQGHRVAVQPRTPAPATQQSFHPCTPAGAAPPPRPAPSPFALACLLTAGKGASAPLTALGLCHRSRNGCPPPSSKQG